MIIMGIDPGYAIVGYGAVEYRNNHFRVLDYGAITTPPGVPFDRRLLMIYEDLQLLLKQYAPRHLAIEKLFFNSNTTTALDVSQARGVILLAARQHEMQIGEYTPLQVKQAVVGYGRAEKRQVMEMTKLLLNLDCLPRPDDAADALALAICHAHCT